MTLSESPHRTRTNITLPPPGVFDWHYLQCVLLRFATDQYQQLPNITFFVHAFKTADDESDDLDEFEDDINDEPPYPSYRFDRLMKLKWEKHREKERLKEVAQWVSNVGSVDLRLNEGLPVLQEHGPLELLLFFYHILYSYKLHGSDNDNLTCVACSFWMRVRSSVRRIF